MQKQCDTGVEHNSCFHFPWPLGSASTERTREKGIWNRILTIVFFIPFFAMCAYASGQDIEKKPSAPKKESTLDKRLRDSLDDDLLSDLPMAPKKTTKAAPDRLEEGKAKGDESPGQLKPKSALDNKLLDQLGEGEDVDLRHPTDPLSKIGQSMRKVEGLIGQRDTSRNTQELQRQIASDLDLLIKELQKQQNQRSSGGKSSKSSQQSSSGSGNKQPMERPASESSQRVEKSTVKADNSAELQKLIKEVWGHLPARVREQMQNVTDEQFLPQYEKLIEEYYRRLAEQGAKSP